MVGSVLQHLALPLGTFLLAYVTFALLWIFESALRWFRPQSAADDLGAFPGWLALGAAVLAVLLTTIGATALPTAPTIAIACGAFAFAATVDGRIRVIPNSAAIVIAIIGLLDVGITHNWLGALGGVAGVAVLMLLLSLSGAWRVSAGDVKLALAMGLVLNGLLAPAALLVGLVIAEVFLMVRRARSRLPIHGSLGFGPFLALGAASVASLTLWSASWTIALRGAP